MSLTKEMKLSLTLFVSILQLLTTLLISSSGSGSLLGTHYKREGDKVIGPLRSHPLNPRYFTNGSGKAIYLTGSHTWNNLIDIGYTDPPSPFNYTTYLDFLHQHNHNFIRLWRWEFTKYRHHNTLIKYATPHPWPRTGRETALDGKPKFDLNKFNQAYFDRLRSRVIAAHDRGIYVSIMLFEGFMLQFDRLRFTGHPFHKDNNINGINGDPNGDGRGLETHTMHIPAVTAIQEAYISKVIDTVNDLDNVLYEIANESGPYSTDWQYHMINYIKKYEERKPKQHPVGMTFQHKGGNNDTLFESPADWISPNPGGGYKKNPPAADGNKIIISDTDHLWGIGGNYGWVWKSFLKGLNPIFMDPYTFPGKLEQEKIRKSMGFTLSYAKKVNLANMIPRGDLASTGYCLANLGKEYLVYLPTSGNGMLGKVFRFFGMNETVTVDLSVASGTLNVEWFNPKTSKTTDGGTTTGGAGRFFTAPFSGDAILYIYMS